MSRSEAQYILLSEHDPSFYLVFLRFVTHAFVPRVFACAAVHGGHCILSAIFARLADVVNFRCQSAAAACMRRAGK